MEDILSKLDVNKRNRIINSALEEFSKNGYQNTSTNAIVKKAEISKGLLFHYFGNKKELYNSLEKFVITTIKNSIVNQLNWEETDFFNRIQEVTNIKMALTIEYPYIYEFATEMFKDKSAEDMREKTNEEFGDLVQKIYTHNISYDKFKEGLDMKKTMDIIKWSIEKLGDTLWQKVLLNDSTLDVKALEEESNGYFEALRKAFYKEDMEGQND